MTVPSHPINEVSHNFEVFKVSIYCEFFSGVRQDLTCQQRVFHTQSVYKVFAQCGAFMKIKVFFAAEGFPTFITCMGSFSTVNFLMNSKISL